jgi:hypothetical protein
VQVIERLAERFRMLGHTAVCAAVAELVQHLGGGHRAGSVLLA